MLKNYDLTKTYLIACSGGPDSMALLDMLVNHNFHIIVAHVNYKTRPESDSEEKLVIDYCIKNNLNYEIAYFDNNYKGSFEDVARKFRYNFFSIIYKKYNCNGLFVAHHKDDLIETYLLKKQRNVVNESYLIKEETIFFDDKEKNVIAANEIGIKAIQFKNVKDIYDNLDIDKGSDKNE